jgi:hypothetical protein
MNKLNLIKFFSLLITSSIKFHDDFNSLEKDYLHAIECIFSSGNGDAVIGFLLTKQSVGVIK